MSTRIYEGFIQATVVIIISVAYFQGVHQFAIAAI